jgi:hypothetical protein
MQPSGNLATFRAWRKAPLMTKVAVMARMMCNDAQPLTAISRLIALVVLMASSMSAEARIAIADQLRQEADQLSPPHDRLLH